MNRSYGYPSMGGNDDSVTNKNCFYVSRIDQEAVECEKMNVETYTSMNTRHKNHIFTLDSAANGNIAP